MELLCDQCSTKCLNLSRGFERVRKIKKRKLVKIKNIPGLDLDPDLEEDIEADLIVIIRKNN